MNRFVTNNIDRLQKLNNELEWVLIPPNASAPAIEIVDIQQFVEQYQEFTPVSIQSLDQIWRIVVIERETGQITASVRIIVSAKKTNDAGWVNDIVRYGGVGFENQGILQLHIDAIESTARSMSGSDRLSIAYVGEMVVSKPRRRSWLPVLLGCGIHSVSQFCRCDIGLAFANHSNNADKLFLKLGGFELQQANGQSLPAFICTQHRSPGRLIGLRSARTEDSPLQSVLDAISNSMKHSLCEQGVHVG